MAIAAGADALGLVGAMPTPVGVIDDGLAASIARRIPPPVAGVALTSEQTAEAMAAHVERVGINTLQVVHHGDPAVLDALRGMMPRLRIIQVVHVEGEDALALIDRYKDVADAFLLDSGKPSAGGRALGGTGQTHDWQVSAAFVKASPRPVFLAGGLNPDNIEEAIRAVRPFGVDVCSRLRTDGALDTEKLHAFLEGVRRADS